MKIIFLDIDGVLNTMSPEDDLPAAYSNSGVYYKDFNDLPLERCVNNLNKILKETDAEIVISSTWRIIHSNISLMYIFFLCGIKPPFILGSTPRTGKKRGIEIAEWLKEHPKVERFVIIDDDSDMVDLMDHLIQIDSEVGLTEDDANKIIEILNADDQVA